MIFLRPWLLLLMLVPFISYWIKSRTATRTPWEKVIDKRLLPYLLVGGTGTAQKRHSVYEGLVWILMAVAAAGPAWNKADVPTRLQLPATVIMAELGPALTQAELQQMRQKIYDTLTHLKGEQVGLVLYDNQGYTASPLTPDREIIRNLVPALDTGVLPEVGARADMGFIQADKLFQNAGVDKGRILFLTTGAFDVEKTQEVAKRLPHTIGILGIGKGDGTPVPLKQGGFLTDAEGQPVLTRLDNAALNRIGTFTKATATDDDIRSLLKKTQVNATGAGQKTEQTTTVWRDGGIYLLLLALPLFAFLFRRGVYFVLILALLSTPVTAGFWQRPDQEAYARHLQGVEAYRAQKYDNAATLFQSDTSPEGLYNLGNALAFQNKIDEAITAYDKVLKQNPDHADARFNKEYLEQQKQQEQKNNQQNQEQKESEEQREQQNQDNQSNQNNDSPSDSEKQSNQQNAAESQNQPAEAESQEQAQQTDSEPQDSAEQRAVPPPQDLTETDEEPTEQETAIDFSPETEPFDQESKQILNRLKQDPSRVLRYRIYQQYQKLQGSQQ